MSLISIKQSLGSRRVIYISLAFSQFGAQTIPFGWSLNIETRLKRSVSVGAMRTALNRLEKKGYLSSHFGEATASRGGKRKRFFKVTPVGKEALDHIMETRKQLWEAIPSVAFDFKFA